MKNDKLKQFVALRNNLTSEKTQLEERLKEINAALGTSGSEMTAPVHRAEQARAAGRKSLAPKRRTKAGRGGITLKEAVTKLTNAKPLTKQEIVAGLASTGYKTKSNDPANLLNRLIYGKHAAFKNSGGKFSPK